MTMKVVRIVVEGPTEEGFVNRVLAPHLKQFYLDVKTHPSYNVPNLKKLKRIADLYFRDANVVAVTTMFDLYELSPQYTALVPNYTTLNGKDQAIQIQQALIEHVNHPKFIPYIQLHEFEALLLSEPEKIGEYYNRNVKGLIQLCSSLRSPEEINHGRETAPSKRIIRVIEEYEDEKPIAGPVISEQIGLRLMREKCPHFRQWVTALENLGTTFP
jgi:hypothetical protein